jgi:hypothetical protein
MGVSGIDKNRTVLVYDVYLYGNFNDEDDRFVKREAYK